MLTSRRRAPLTALLASGVLALAACGGDAADDVAVGAPATAPSDGAGEPAAPGPTSAATEPPAPTDGATTAPPASGTTAPATDAPGTGAPGLVVPAALDVVAPLVGGGELDLGTLADRPVLLWFWAPF